MQNSHSRRAFTLIELLIVIAIISLLAAILFPVFARARENAETTIMGITGTPCVYAYETSNRSSTVQYKTVAVDENGKVTSPWVDVKLSAEVGAERYTTVTMFGGMTAETPLTGHLFISWTISFSNPIEKYVLVTSDMEPNFYKGTASNGNAVPLTHTRDKYGAIEVDSTPFLDSNGSWLILQPFTANLSGTWSTVGAGTTLSWSGLAGSVMSSDPKSYQVSVTKTDSQFPFTATLNVAANDAVDGLKAGNSYKVTWHLPFEKQSDVIGFPKDVYVAEQPISTLVSGDLSTPLGISYPTGEIPTKYFVDALGIISDAAAKIVKITDGIVNDPYHYSSLSVTTNPSDAWARAGYLDTQNGNGPDHIPGTLTNTTLESPWTLCNYQYSRVVHYHSKRWFADAYDQNGYMGNDHLLGSDEPYLVQPEPWFTQSILLP